MMSSEAPPAARTFRSFLRCHAVFAGPLAVFLGLMVLLGWKLGSVRLTSCLPGWPPMLPNTALMIVISGTSQILAATAPVTGGRRVASRLCAAMVGVLAVLTLAQYVLGRSFGIDQVIFRIGAALDVRFPGRPSPQTATTLLFLSAALLSIDHQSPRGRRPAEGLAMVAGSIPLVCLLGYLFKAEVLYDPFFLLPHTGMAVHTALALFILSSGVLAARAEAGVMSVLAADDAGGIAARRLLLGLLLFPPVVLGILLGTRAGWYTHAVALALVLLIVLAMGGGFILMTAAHLSRRDAQLRKVDAALRASIESEQRLRAELEALMQASATISESVVDLPQGGISAVLHAIANQAKLLTNAQYVAIGVGTDPENPRSPWVSLGIPRETAAAIGPPSRPVGILGRVSQEGESIRIEDLQHHPSFRGFPPDHPEMHSFLACPIKHRGKPLGNLYLANKLGAAEFSEHDERLIRVLAVRMAVAIDIANLYASEALQRAWLQTLIDQMPEGVLLVDASGHVVTQNQALIAMSCGPTGDTDPIGNPRLFDVRTPDQRPVPFDDLPAIRAVFRGVLSKDRELLLCQRDGTMRPISVNASPVRDLAGQITGAAAIIQDISARKELERLREEWTAMVAHDLRQPVNTIALSAETLRRLRASDLAEYERRALDRICCAAQRLARMIGDLLDVAQLEAKRLTVRCQEVDLQALLKSAVQCAEEATAGYRLSIVARPEQKVWLDPDRIHQVLANLLSNAAKYGRPKSEIGIEIIDRNDMVEVAVTNQGDGIPADQLPLLFSRFMRTRDARASATPGLGLGLYISKGLIEAHGGRMWAESVPGASTCFHFTVPKRSR